MSVTAAPHPLRFVGRACVAAVLVACAMPISPALAAPRGAKPEAAPVATAASAPVRSLLAELTAGREARRQARLALIAYGPPFIPELVAEFDSEIFTIRWEIANILGLIGHPDAVPALVERVLVDANPHVRWRSLWALRNIPDDSIPERFRAELENPDATLRWNAAVGGSLFGVADGLPILQAGTVATQEFRAWEAVNALSRLTDRSSVPVLQAVLAQHRSRLRREAVLSLGQLLDQPGAIDTVVRALADDDPELRWRAAMVLGRASGAEATVATVALRERQAIEADDQVQEHLERSLRRLRKGRSSSRQLRE